MIKKKILTLFTFSFLLLSIIFVMKIDKLIHSHEDTVQTQLKVLSKKVCNYYSKCGNLQTKLNVHTLDLFESTNDCKVLSRKDSTFLNPWGGEFEIILTPQSFKIVTEGIEEKKFKVVTNLNDCIN